MDQGWALYSWDIENDGWLAFSGIKRQEAGFMAKHVKRLLAKKSGLNRQIKRK